MKYNTAPDNDVPPSEKKYRRNRSTPRSYCYIQKETKWAKVNIKNYRAISLLSHAYKIFTRIIQSRIKRILDENQPREHAGFRERFWQPYICYLHSRLTLNQLIEKANEYKLELRFVKDTLTMKKPLTRSNTQIHSHHWEKIGVSEGHVHIMKDIHTNTTITNPFRRWCIQTNTHQNRRAARGHHITSTLLVLD